MTKNSHLIAQYAQLAMILEVCATPKPGNIDRDHNYPDTQFEHFLASAVSVYPVMKKASTDSKDIGRYIYSAVMESAKWQSGGNTHFGAFILLVPLVMAGGRIADKIDGTTSIFPELNRLTVELIKNTGANDAVALYRAFATSGVRVKDVCDLDLNDPSSIEEIRTNGTSLYQLMEISSSYDMIAREWTAGYPLTFKCANSILEKYNSTNINDAVVVTFMEILADNPDTFIQTKSDKHVAQKVSDQAKQIVDKINNSGFENTREDIMKLDEQFIKDGINPGSTADIIIAGLFVALLGGLRF
jgi:triphosphoribosyl-dephospho-CoA synthase